jgi:hypothetical protein
MFAIDLPANKENQNVINHTVRHTHFWQSQDVFQIRCRTNKVGSSANTSGLYSKSYLLEFVLRHEYPQCGFLSSADHFPDNASN